MTTTTDAASRVARGPVKLNLALREHAAGLDGQPINTATLAAHLVQASFDSDRLIAAALLHAWWGPAADHLPAALAAVNSTDYDLDRRAEHDGVCRLADFAYCDACDDIRIGALTDALNGLRAILGDTVCTDLTAAVTA